MKSPLVSFVLFLLLSLLFLGSPVSAGDVIVTSAKSEYRFGIGEEARIPFTVESSFPAVNVGTLAYTLTRKESQAGYSFSQSSSQSQSFPISPGRSQNALTLTSEVPTEYEVTLSIQYRDDGKDFTSQLPMIRVFFDDPTQSSQQGSGQSESSSQGEQIRSTTSEDSNSGQTEGASPFAEIEQQMNTIRQQNQQMLQQALSPQGMNPGVSPQQSPQTAQQALQNNQMNAQASALQQQLAQEIAQKEKDKQDISRSIEGDPLLEKMAEVLNEAGYEQKDGSITPEGEGTGRIDATFENQAGSIARMAGDVRNGSVEKITTTSDDSLPIPQSLTDDPRYKAARETLADAGFNTTGASIDMTLNETRIQEQFRSPEGKNATISAFIQNETVVEVILKKDEDNLFGWYLGIVLIILLIALCVWAGLRYYQNREIILPQEPEIGVEPLDITAESLRILSEAEAECAAGRMKEAYARAGQGARFFISHTLGSGAADTSDEIFSLLSKAGIYNTPIRDILNDCTLVEFARSEGTTDECTRIISKIRGFIADHSSTDPSEQTAE